MSVNIHLAALRDEAEHRLFPHATLRLVRVGDCDIHLRMMGAGPPLLLLHGYPQTHAIWHRVAPRLATTRTLIMPDLVGYGRSRRRTCQGPDAYAKRPAAAAMVELMAALGFPRFDVAGHDRGGRIAHRMTLDYPQFVRRIAVLDIVPTLHRFEHVDMAVATKAYHWFFLSQPAPFPERLIAADPDYFLRHTLNSWACTLGFWNTDAYASYLASLSDPAVIAATCDDYRASATIDLEHDRADRGRKLAPRLLALWGAASPQSRSYEVRDIWRNYAQDVCGHGIVSGHFLAEEAADDTAGALDDFFREDE